MTERVSSCSTNYSYSPSQSSISSFNQKRSNSDNSNSNSNDLDYTPINKYLNNGKDSLLSHGGDITRNFYLLNQDNNKRKRSSSFSKVFDHNRTSSVSEMNLPGGFRRDFINNLNNNSINYKRNNFITKNFLEFLSIYGHFAGENLNDDFTNYYGNDGDAIVDEESQLLPNHDGQFQHTGTASSTKTFFLLFKSLVGSGVLFLPKAFLNGGLLFSSLTILLFGILTFFCYFVLIESKIHSNLKSFGELGFATYGPVLKYSILVSIIFSQIGFVSSYLIFVCENLVSFLQQFDILTNHLSIVNIIFLQFVFLIPLVLLRDLTKLSITSLISSVCILFGLIIISYYSGIQIWEHGVGDIKQFNSNSWPMLIGVAVTAFEGVGLILPIQSSMAKPENFPRILFLTMSCITLLFIFIGSIGYMAYGSHTLTIIILNLPNGSLSVSSIKILYSLAVFLTAPLQLFPVIKIFESLIFNNIFKSESGKYNPLIKWSKNLLRVSIVLGVSILAVLGSSNLDKFVSINGCFACIPLVYIYPPLIHLKYFKNSEKGNSIKDKLIYLDFLIIIVGTLAVCYTTYQIIAFN